MRDKVREITAAQFTKKGISGKALGEAIHAERIEFSQRNLLPHSPWLIETTCYFILEVPKTISSRSFNRFQLNYNDPQQQRSEDCDMNN